jgi:hypothetical protein
LGRGSFLRHYSLLISPDTPRAQWQGILSPQHLVVEITNPKSVLPIAGPDPEFVIDRPLAAKPKQLTKSRTTVVLWMIFEEITTMHDTPLNIIRDPDPVTHIEHPITIIHFFPPEKFGPKKRKKFTSHRRPRIR